MTVNDRRPLFTFIVAAYNASGTITETIGSVVAQSVGTWEMVVVDDGSTDSTSTLIAAAASEDARIRVFRQANAGTASARNNGAGYARGDYWVFLDADDMVRADYVERQLAFAEAHPGYDIYSCNADMLLPNGELRPMWKGPRYAKPFSLTVEDQLRESSIPPFSASTPRLWRLVGGFRDLHSEDYDYWLRGMILGATHIFNPDVLAIYRRQEGTKTRQLVAEAESFLQIKLEALQMPELSESQRAAARAAIAFSEARVRRRQLEEALLAGDLRGARSRYWKARTAFPNRVQYVVGLAIMTASPRLYARIKARRMF